MEKYKNRYRIKSHRMPNWNYSMNGIYFFTIVTQNRECNLGRIVNTNGCPYIELSDFGKIVETEFLKSFNIRHELFLDTFIIMPNHLHAIIVLQKTTMGIGANGANKTHVETHGRASLQQSPVPSSQPSFQQLNQQSVEPQKFIRLPKSISSFMAGFKSTVNTKIDNYIDDYHLDIPKYNRNSHFFQPNYHDHIIRNNAEYEGTRNYIINNPVNWKNDKFKPDNIQ